MKTILCLFVLFFSSLMLFGQEKGIQQISYRSFTRGYEKIIEISPDSIRIQEKSPSNWEKPKEWKVAIPAGKWQELINELAEVKLETLPELEAPSKNRARDAAPHGQLIVQTDQKNYASPQFDGYRAHPKLAGLMQYIQEIEKKISTKE